MYKLCNQIENEIVEKYKIGYSNKDLSNEFSLHRSTIQRVLKRNNINLHYSKSKLKCNDNLFSTYNEISCYWAGFILADGYIRKDSPTLHIKLSSKDVLHLNKFQECIKCEENKN